MANTGDFNKTILTKAGKEMIAKSQGGQTLRITRVILGDGILTASDHIEDFTAVKSPRLSANIADFTNGENGLYTVQFRMSNANVDAGFWLREMGIMAQIDEGAEALYAYTNASGQGNFIYDKTTPLQERVYDIDFGVGDAENIEIVINSSIVYVTLQKFEEAMTAHDKASTAHAAAFKAHNEDTAAHKNFVAATASAAGTRGMVPAPDIGTQNKFLRGDGLFADPPTRLDIDIIKLIYPVGSVIELTNDTDPNKIWSGTTWVKMDAGRVLISARTYKEGDQTYTYALGDKGGEAKHQITADEVAKHGHDLTIDSTSIRGSLHVRANDAATTGVFRVQQENIRSEGNADHNLRDRNIELMADHGHTGSAKESGGDQPHENRQPYEVIFRWKRVADANTATVSIHQSAHQNITVQVDETAHTKTFVAPVNTQYEAQVVADEGYTAGVLSVKDTED